MKSSIWGLETLIASTLFFSFFMVYAVFTVSSGRSITMSIHNAAGNFGSMVFAQSLVEELRLSNETLLHARELANLSGFSISPIADANSSAALQRIVLMNGTAYILGD